MAFLNFFVCEDLVLESLLNHYFFCVFAVCFAVCLLLFVLFVLPSPLLELCPAVLCHPCCCVCHICVVLAVVPGVSPCFLVRLRGVFWGSCVFFVAFAVASALWFSSPLVFCGCWCVVLVLWSVGCLVCGCVLWLLRVCLVCCLVVLLFLSVLVLFCFGLSAVLVAVVLAPLFCGPPGVGCSSWLLLVLLFVFWLVVVVVLLCPLFCSWCVLLLLVVSGSLFLLCVAPSWCWFMRFLLSWWFLVVVGPLPLFCADLGCFSSSWFFFLTFSATPGWGGLCVVLPVLV